MPTASPGVKRRDPRRIAAGAAPEQPWHGVLSHLRITHGSGTVRRSLFADVVTQHRLDRLPDPLLHLVRVEPGVGVRAQAVDATIAHIRDESLVSVILLPGARG